MYVFVFGVMRGIRRLLNLSIVEIEFQQGWAFLVTPSPAAATWAPVYPATRQWRGPDNVRLRWPAEMMTGWIKVQAPACVWKPKQEGERDNRTKLVERQKAPKLPTQYKTFQDGAFLPSWVKWTAGNIWENGRSKTSRIEVIVVDRAMRRTVSVHVMHPVLYVWISYRLCRCTPEAWLAIASLYICLQSKWSLGRLQPYACFYSPLPFLGVRPIGSWNINYASMVGCALMW